QRRRCGARESHGVRAAFARSTVSSTSSAIMFGTAPIVSAVAGLMTSIVAMSVLLFRAQDPALAGQALRKGDGDDGQCEDKEDDDVDLRELLAETDLAEDPDR